MILECIVTTINKDGSTNIAPMGPVFDESDFQSFVLRPFQTARTFENLNRSKEGVLHITDDVKLFVAGALDSFDQIPELIEADLVCGQVLQDCCRYHEFRVSEIDTSNQRTELKCEVVATKDMRPFLGFNRAKHAVLELTILATRIHLMDKESIVQQHAILKSAVDKTGGSKELMAFEKLEVYLRTNGFEL